MSDPTTGNIVLAIPSRGTDSGTWDTPVNNNMTELDGILGGLSTISLSSSTTFALSTPAAGSIATTAGPNQSSNACIKLTGTLTGNCTIKLTMPRMYVIDNQCVVGSFFVKLAPNSGGGTSVGCPPGQKTNYFFDGTNVDYVSMPPVGSALDLHGVTSLPAWITACTVQPYLIKNGTVLNISSFTALGNFLGSTFGGNGVTTFGLPDESARARIAYDSTSSNRLTSAVSGVNGATMGSAGGDQRMQSHNHTDAGHTHGYGGPSGAQQSPGGSGLQSNNVATTTQIGTAIISTTGAGSSQNVQPSIISFLPLIKT